MSTEPEADERRVRHMLRQRIDGPTAHQPAPVQTIPPKPDHAPHVPHAADDWVDEVLAKTRAASAPAWNKPTCEHTNPVEVRAQPTDELVAYLCRNCDEQLEVADQEGPAGGEVRWLQPQPGYYPPLPAVLPAVQKTPAALSPKTRQLIYNAGAAGAGYGFGLLDLFARAINDCGTETGIGGALVLGIGSCLLIAHIWDRRTRHWWIGLAWAARIPLATAITALALYAPASQL
ncbi:hypothetical protein ACFVWX_13460 [Streptomyces sp. NPDC058220]|uniref:hypothetical protein n=1 Tax=Streptomyces sp. NPDC058220 TaxID=3346387 RepID=UPI0036EA6B95